MYQYNFFCFVFSLIGTMIALFILKDHGLAIIMLILCFFNYYLYDRGREKAEAEKKQNT